MVLKLLHKIDVCDECYDRKAEYFLFDMIERIFFKPRINYRFVCKKCLKKIRGEME